MARNLREHILQTASELFYRQGIKATGVDTIVKATGIAKMSLYKYFPSKDDLVLAHLQRSREIMRAHILSGIETRTSDPKQKLLAVFEVFEELLENPSFRGCPFINASAEFAEEASPIQQAAAEFSESFRKMLAGLAQEAGIAETNAEELSKQLSMLIAGAMVREQMQRHSKAMRTAHAAAVVLIEKSLADAPIDPASA
jgi:AcrR family transcriptional regulator